MTMRPFADHDFLLQSATARHLFHDYAEQLPIVDYHCHISPREIYENRRFDNLAQVWLGGRNPDGTLSGDHYKWRVMRSNGVSEDYITGSQPDRERIRKFAEALEMAIGNPMYHWCNLELRKYFGYQGYLSPATVDEVWDLTSEKLRTDDAMTARGLIAQSNVAMVGTTDDPVDSLEWHKKIAADPTITVKVCPSFRPDKAIAIHKKGFTDYMGKLAASVGKQSLSSAGEVCDALVERLVFFAKLGCRASDHGMDYVPYRPGTMEQADDVFRKVMKGEAVSVEEADLYQTVVLLHLGRAYHRLGIAMQIHYSTLRNANQRAFAQLGPDAGYDMMGQNSCGINIVRLLSDLDSTDECPRTILYSLNPVDNAQLGTLLGCFQSPEIPGKIQHGSAWWFNDTKTGMEEQMTSLANLGLLGNFVGMLTDSRSFLSYARHDYFRRIFCNLVGGWVENGEYPNDEAALKKIVEGVCCYNAIRYFNL